MPGEASGNADSAAELAVLLLLALVRRLDEVRAALTGRRWPVRPTGGSLAGTTVAIVGLGAIGAALARRLVPFGVRLLAVRARPWLGAPPGVDLVTGPADLAGVLGEADAVVCAALFDGAQPPMFDAAAFAAMRPGALFVNVARGGLVDEDALLAALEAGQLAAERGPDLARVLAQRRRHPGHAEPAVDLFLGRAGDQLAAGRVEQAVLGQLELLAHRDLAYRDVVGPRPG